MEPTPSPDRFRPTGTSQPRSDRASGAPDDGWLRLLAADAESDVLHAHREAQLAAAPDAATRDLVAAAAHFADTISAHLAERRTQAREMTVLNSLARRLTSLRDPRELLQEVAVQSRQLVGVSVAYIMLVTKAGDLRIDVVDGSMGSALRGIVLREGEGLGGEVIRTGRPLWSEAYLDDARLQRLDSVDSAAASEKLGGILAVPLQVGEENLGVLCAADRRPRRFSDHDVELLAHLAAHAAVALRNAQVFEELEATNTALRRTDAARQRANDLRELLTAEVIRGADAVALRRSISGVVGHPVVLFGSDGRSTEAAPSSGERPFLALIREWQHHPPSAGAAAGATSETTAREGRPLTAVPIVLADGVAGGLGIEEDIDDDTRQLMQIGASAVALVMSHERTVAEVELRTRGEIVSTLLSHAPDEASLRRRAATARIDLDAVRSVVVLDPGDRDVRPARQAASRVADLLDGWAAEHAGTALVLVPTLPPRDVKQRLHEATDGDLDSAVGIASCSGGVAGVRAAHESARQAASLLLAMGRDTATVIDDELGVYRSLFSHAGRGGVEAFVQATVGPLLEYDNAQGRDMALTVATYLALAQHHARTSEQLHIHPNTLYQRLARVDSLLGPTWRGPQAALQIQLALQMRSLMLTLGAR